MMKEIQLNNQEKYEKASSFMLGYAQNNKGSRNKDEKKIIYQFNIQYKVIEFFNSKKFMIVGENKKLINQLEKELNKFNQNQEIGKIVKEGFNILKKDLKLVKKLRE